MQTPKFSVWKLKQKQQQKQRKKTTVKPTLIPPIGEDHTAFKHCINVLRRQGFSWEFWG
jgi:hypothetical protein